MAKKAVKKEAPAAKAKKKAKPAAKAPAKPVKSAAKPVKAPAKAAAKAAAKPAPAAKAKPAKAKPAKAEVKPAKAAPAKKVAASAPSAKPAKVEKPAKEEKAPKAERNLKLVEPAAEVVEDTPKKEKKVKINKTGLNEDQVKWHELHEKYKGLKAPNYTISGQFEAKTPIQHKIFGWGFVLSNEYDRLEVLFEDAKRMLISNRKLS